MKQLYISNDKKLLGICAGVAEYLNVDPTLIRIAVVCISLLTAVVPALVIYFVLSLVFPKAPADYVPKQPAKKLIKGNDKKLSGVCSGLAEYFGIDATIVRLIFAICILFLGYGVMTYLVCLVMMPSAPLQVVTEGRYEN